MKRFRFFRKFHVKFIWFLSGVTLLTFSLHLFHTYCLQSSIARYKLMSELTVNYEKDSGTKVVVFWTKFFDVPFWGMKKETYREEDLQEINCPTTNCLFTHKKEHLQNSHEYDAIIFHGAETWNFLDLPKTRSPYQSYVMMSKESPGEIKHNLKQDHDFYNLTMTYRLDSDIPMSYGIVTDIVTGSIVAPALNVQWRDPDDYYDKAMFEIIEKKRKTAAWFVSHCEVMSRRGELVNKLKQLIDVDVYGKCGTLSCPRGSEQCNEMLNSTYRFYLAFENTLCTDYLTEKLFNVINDLVIPVIYSGADIARFLPPMSYIDANSFATAEDLALHLKYLSRTPLEYIKFFWWKKYYKIEPIHDTNRIICKVCQKLNEPNFSHKKQTYINIHEWFYNSCKRPKILF